MRAVTVWPFPDAEVALMAARVKRIIVCENNLGQLVHFVRSAVGGHAGVDLLTPDPLGTLLDPEDILAVIKEDL